MLIQHLGILIQAWSQFRLECLNGLGDIFQESVLRMPLKGPLHLLVNLLHLSFQTTNLGRMVVNPRT